MTRAEKVAEAQRLRAEGLLMREIAERMGSTRSTVDSWINDPDGAKLAARKVSYAPTCEVCGGRMNGSAGLVAPRSGVCMPCRTWSDEAIIDAIRRWADEHGGVPPREIDWMPTPAGYPAASVVCGRMGWNAALMRAGFGLRCDRRPETTDWIIAEVKSGRSVVEIARRLGTSPSNIYQRIWRRGVRVPELRNAA